jgi:hypothetical protein
MYPSILCLKLDQTNLAFDTDVRGLVKEYSHKIIEFVTNTAN